METTAETTNVTGTADEVSGTGDADVVKVPLRQWRYSWIAALFEFGLFPIVVIPIIVIFGVGLTLQWATEGVGGWYDDTSAALREKDRRRVAAARQHDESGSPDEGNNQAESEEGAMTATDQAPAPGGENEKGTTLMITLYGCSDDTVVVTGCDGDGEFSPRADDDLWQGDLVAPSGEQMTMSCWYGGDGYWHCGVGQTDAGTPLPDWKIIIEQHPVFPYSVQLTVNAPLGTKLMNVEPDQW